MNIEDLKDGTLLVPLRYEERRFSNEWIVKEDYMLPLHVYEKAGQAPEKALFIGPMFDGQYGGVHCLVSEPNMKLIVKMFKLKIP